jgi:3-deoxy-manno-octulosonate cytidylyltransferase (CMP-KDO synthetase)
MRRAAIIIPARYHSTRLPGKPLEKIAGKTMLARVCDIAKKAADIVDGAEILVATEDKRIAEHAESCGVRGVLTSSRCKTGSDRALEAIAHLKEKPDFIVNLQGDAPLTPPDFVAAVLTEFYSNPDLEVVTPVAQLDWDALDLLRRHKQDTPLSGTTAIIGKSNEALWFSKNIIPAIRDEEEMRKNKKLSPVFRHIGIYGFRSDILKRFVRLPQSRYEILEGLEQLRMLENNISIRAVLVDYKGRPAMSGIDSPEDILRAEELLKQYGEIAA